MGIAWRRRKEGDETGRDRVISAHRPARGISLLIDAFILGMGLWDGQEGFLGYGQDGRRAVGYRQGSRVDFT